MIEEIGIDSLQGYGKTNKLDVYIGNIKKLDNFSVSKANNLGIVTFFQDKALCTSHNIWRNIFMGREITNNFGFVNFKKEREETEFLMRDVMGFTSEAINPDAVVAYMSGGEQQGVAISRVIYFNSKLVILDEPTTGLSLKETMKVLDFVRKIKKENKSCILFLITFITSTKFLID
jgi:simple sugar transport system ATP-binding protein